MIRRGFWLAAGAVTGIYGYRRVSAAGRRLSASRAPGSTTLGDRGHRGDRGNGNRVPVRLAVRRTRRGAVALARETCRFTRDVREGLELYMVRHPAPAGSTLSADRSTDHDALPEDGH